MTSAPRRQLHLGAGAFARGHLWLCTAQAEPDHEWAVVAVAQRSPKVVDALLSTDGSYHVLEEDGSRVSVKTVDVVGDAFVAAADPARLEEALGDPGVSVVTITATEQAYPVTEDGSLDVAAVADDLADDGLRSLVAQVVRTARIRLANGADPVAFLVCDNMMDGGSTLQRLAIEYAGRLGLDREAAWLRDAATFPNTVVDRIVPALTEDEQKAAQLRAGVEDDALVVGEPFFRWVITDDFPGPRPTWERGGATLVTDAAPWQAAKLHLVNAVHSVLAYPGLLLGLDATRDAVAHDRLRAAAEETIRRDLLPAVPSAEGLDPAEEGRNALRRFANPAIRHPLAQIGAGGSTKLRQRFTVPMRLAAEEGRPSVGLALTLAAWAVAAKRELVEAPPELIDGSWTARAEGALAATALASVAGADTVGAIARYGEQIDEHGISAALETMIDG